MTAADGRSIIDEFDGQDEIVWNGIRESIDEFHESDSLVNPLAIEIGDQDPLVDMHIWGFTCIQQELDRRLIEDVIRLPRIIRLDEPLAVEDI